MTSSKVSTKEPIPLHKLILDFLFWIPLNRAILNVMDGRSLLKLDSWTSVEKWLVAGGFSLVGTYTDWRSSRK